MLLRWWLRSHMALLIPASFSNWCLSIQIEAVKVHVWRNSVLILKAALTHEYWFLHQPLDLYRAIADLILHFPPPEFVRNMVLIVHHFRLISLSDKLV